MCKKYGTLHELVCHASCCSVTQSCLNLYDPTDSSVPGFPVFHCPLGFTDSVMPSCQLVLCPQSFPASESFPTSWLFASGGKENWCFGFSISPSNEYLGLISFRIDWFDLLAVQGTLKSLLQHHSSKASIPRRSAFFTVQLSHPAYQIIYPVFFMGV